MLPGLRSAYIERFEGGPDAVTLYRYVEYLDEQLLDRGRYVRADRRAMLRTAIKADFDVLAVPEAFWIVEAPIATALALGARIGAALRGRRVAIVTYAIENAPPERLMGLPQSIPAAVRLLALRVFTLPLLLSYTRIAFGTQGAADNYLSGVGRALGRRIASRSLVVPPIAPACACVTIADRSTRPPTALFLGPLATRKGFDRLLAAWPAVVRQHPDARLVVCGAGALQPELDLAMADHPSISQEVDASRERIHELLRLSRVLVSLPRAERRWREQIGLSLPEGISHGAHIVTTDQSGISGWLADHGQTIVVDDDAETVAAALVAALRTPNPVPLDSLPMISGRASAEWWMATGELDPTPEAVS